LEMARTHFLWYDNWINLLTLLGLHAPPDFSKDWKVATILEDGEWCMQLNEL